MFMANFCSSKPLNSYNSFTVTNHNIVTSANEAPQNCDGLQQPQQQSCTGLSEKRRLSGASTFGSKGRVRHPLSHSILIGGEDEARANSLGVQCQQ